MKTRRNLQRLGSLAVLAVAVGLSSCGDPKGYHSFDPNCQSPYPDNSCPDSITLTPASASVQAFGGVVLQGKVTGFSTQQTVQWRVQGPPVIQGLACGYTNLTDATYANCPYGYVIYSAAQPPYNAIYYAPGNSGTYQVALSVYPADTGTGVIVYTTITVD